MGKVVVSRDEWVDFGEWGLKFERKTKQKTKKNKHLFWGWFGLEWISLGKKLDLYIEPIHLFQASRRRKYQREGFFLFTIKVHMKFLNAIYRNPLRFASILITNNYPYFWRIEYSDISGSHKKSCKIIKELTLTPYPRASICILNNYLNVVTVLYACKSHHVLCT